jgi:hypothetical protein
MVTIVDAGAAVEAPEDSRGDVSAKAIRKALRAVKALHAPKPPEPVRADPDDEVWR